MPVRRVTPPRSEVGIDTLVPLACHALGAAIPLVIVGLVFRRGARQLRAAATYREVASALGLDVDTRGVSLHGVLDGRTLWVGEVMVGHGPDRRTEVQGVIGLRRALGLGLEVRRRRSRRAAGIALADPELDRRLVAVAAWPDGVGELLAAGALAPLRALVARCPDVSLTDDAIRVRLGRPLDRPAELAALVAALEELAEALERARLAVPTPPALQGWIEPWTEVANQFDLGVVPTLPALRGRLGDHLIEVTPEWASDGYRVRACAWFDPDEPTGLRIEPQRAPDGYQHVGQDIQVGDRAFDGAFVVKGFDPEEVRARLGPDARAALLDLAARGAVTVDDHRLCVSGASPDPVALGALLACVRRAADAIAPRPASAPAWIDPSGQAFVPRVPSPILAPPRLGRGGDDVSGGG